MKKESKDRNRGEYKMVIDKTNNVQCIQWVDSKVVNMASTVLTDLIDEAKRQKGKDKIAFTCPVAVMLYQRFMMGVDKGDQMRACGGGFLCKEHFQNGTKECI
jgi:hypothetical protein